MLLLALRAPVFATNTLVLAPRPGGPAVVVDPGAGVATQVQDVLREHDLTVAAVLLTHGHPDHTWDCSAVAPAAPVYIGEPDVERLSDPAAYLGAGLGPVFASLTSEPWRAPARIEPVAEGRLELAPGLTVRAQAAPGHTAGSTVWWLDGGAEQLVGPPFAEAGHRAHDGPVLLTGDVLFAGSVGRTDLPGGDETRMRESLRALGHEVPPGALLVPGHGPATTMAHELTSNHFLARALS